MGRAQKLSQLPNALVNDSSGNVGIGTSTLDGISKLRVLQGANQVAFLAEGANTPGYPQFGFSGQTADNGGRGTGMYLPVDGSLAFSTAAAERVRIDSGGNVLVGATSTVRGKISVESTFGTQVGVYHNSTTGQSFFSNSPTAAGTGWYHFNGVSSNNTVQNILIYGNGDIKNANNVFSALSDVKLKENIVDATPKLDKLMQVRVVNYNLINDYEKHKQLGVIAQELEQVFPGLVDETADTDAQGDDLGTTTKSVKYSVFVPMLIKALQEQQAMIAQLQADVAALKA